MGYSHYNYAPITDEINKLYQALLDTIKLDDGTSLMKLWCSNIINNDSGDKVPDRQNSEFDENFHEIARDKETGYPILFTKFTKTARKKYDPAVMLSYCYAAHLANKEPSGDYSDTPTDNIMQAIDENNLELMIIGLKHYYQEELDNIDEEEINNLAREFFLTIGSKPYDIEIEKMVIAFQIYSGKTSGNTGNSTRSLEIERNN